MATQADSNSKMMGFGGAPDDDDAPAVRGGKRGGRGRGGGQDGGRQGG